MVAVVWLCVRVRAADGLSVVGVCVGLGVGCRALRLAPVAPGGGVRGARVIRAGGCTGALRGVRPMDALCAVGCDVAQGCRFDRYPPLPLPPPPLPGILPPGVCSGEGASWARLDGAGMAEGGGGVSSADGAGCVGLADGTPGRPLRGGPSKGVGLADPLRGVDDLTSS